MQRSSAPNVDMSMLKFEHWYDPKICEGLLFGYKKLRNFIPLVFHDVGDKNQTSFKEQVQEATMLSSLLEKPCLFISKEPGMSIHYICGVIHNGKLLIFNPLGQTQHSDALHVYREFHYRECQTQFQKAAFEEEGLVSCGPLAVEIARHIEDTLTVKDLNTLIDDRLWIGLKPQSGNLNAILAADSKEKYKKCLESLRLTHHQQLLNQKLTENSCYEQVLFNFLYVEKKTICDLMQSQTYQDYLGHVDALAAAPNNLCASKHVTVEVQSAFDDLDMVHACLASLEYELSETSSILDEVFAAPQVIKFFPTQYILESFVHSLMGEVPEQSLTDFCAMIKAKIKQCDYFTRFSLENIIIILEVFAPEAAAIVEIRPSCTEITTHDPINTSAFDIPQNLTITHGYFVQINYELSIEENAQLTKLLTSFMDEHGFSATKFMTINNFSAYDPAIVRLAVNARNNFGICLLNSMCKDNNFSAVKKLIELGANPNPEIINTSIDASPLSLVLAKDEIDLELLDLLLAAGSELTSDAQSKFIFNPHKISELNHKLAHLKRLNASIGNNNTLLSELVSLTSAVDIDNSLPQHSNTQVQLPVTEVRLPVPNTVKFAGTLFTEKFVQLEAEDASATLKKSPFNSQ